MKTGIPRIMFAAIGSGSGKTTITCAVLQALIDLRIKPSAFKCGPDYIDPMFHTGVIGAKSRNLDLFLLSEDICRYLLAKNSQETQIAILEGVMGYYDGLGANGTLASSYHLACVTNTPVILIVNFQGASLSLAALIKGFVQFREDSRIQGVILNNLSQALYPLYKEMIERETGIQVLGYLPKIKECSLESRHLGLITAAEITDLRHKLKLLAQQAITSIEIEKLIAIAKDAGEFDYLAYPLKKCVDVTLAVAKDKAFCFYYQDSLELLESIGAKILYFSPLHDQALPECEGIILGGGYPEIYAEELSINISMRQSIKKALDKNVPCIAECGGFMYLLDRITDKEGNDYPMTGFLSGDALITDKLNRFGYITLIAQSENLLCGKGERINAHEFHYSDSTLNGCGFTAIKPAGDREWKCINTSQFLFAGYPHLHFWGNVNFAYRFLEKCWQFKCSRH